MRAILVLGVCFSILANAPAAADEGHEYVLEARLHTDTHMVEGQGRIRWRNESRQAQDHLFLHLYLNAFRDAQSVFMKESNQRLRGVRFRGRGAIDLRSFTLDGRDLLADADLEIEEGDFTQARINLPRPVPPGGEITIEMEWTSDLPPVFARSGYHGAFHMVAQWFPKIARLDEDGTWANFPYHGHGEFYADFARYELSVETPPGWMVGATGAMQSEDVGAHWTRRTFVAENVHDTAFATAPWFRETEASYTHPDGRATRVRVLYPPGFESSVRTHLQVTLEGLAHYGEHFGQYPYDVLTVIVPPRGADGAAGMEYPTLFVTAGPWFAADGWPIALHDEVTAHELGHQWFQGLVASNEVRWPMLDEGITEWVTGDLLRQRHGADNSGVVALGLHIDGFELRRGFALRGKPTPPPGRAAHEFRGSAYARSVYGRTSALLETVARTWGRPRFHRALGSYARRQRFAHPTPEDLFAAFDAEYGEWMSRRILRPALMNGATDIQRLSELDRSGGRTRVVAERVGGLALPSHVQLRGSRGVRRFAWPSDQQRLELDIEGDWTSALVDPDRHNLTDPDRRDNGRGAGDEPRLFARFLTWVQVALGWVGP